MTMAMVTVTHERDQAHLVRTRQHTRYVEQPAGGEELGATPAKLTRDQRTGLLTAVEGCTVHNILRQPPDVAVTLDHNRPADEPAAAAGS
jgi:hypothetical protein